MITLLRTDSSHPDFISLVKQLDADLAQRHGEEHAFYDQFNKIDTIRHAVVLYENEKPVSCGAMKPFEPGIIEIKRMFTLSSHRGKGMAGMVLKELENWAKELPVKKCILETGIKHAEAIQLYTRNGYKLIPNYGQYKSIENSVCFEKKITD